MLADTKVQGKDRVNPAVLVTSDFMPFSCTVLTRSLIEYAKTYLNETEDNKERCLRELRVFLKNDLGVAEKIEDIYLLCFLRSRKFDLKRSYTLMKKGIEFADSHKYLFDRTDSQAVRRAVESNAVGFLPYRDAKGRALFYLRSEAWDPNQLKTDDIIFGSIVSLHTAVENPVNQVAGFVVILDFKNLSFHQIVAVSSWLIFGITALQRCCPCLVKEFHIVHTPAIFRTAWKIVKPLLSEKIKKRIMFYRSTHWESLHSRIPPAILPAELGGELGPFSNDHWAADIPAIERLYYKKVRLFMDRKKQGQCAIT